MTRYRATAAGNVPLSPEEEAERDAEEAAAVVAAEQLAAQEAVAAQKALALEQFKNSVRREAEKLEEQGLFVEAFLKLKTIGE